MKAISIILASALITTAAIKAAPALAESAPAGDINVSLVRTADLDLGSEAGRRQLDRRLARAVREVCGAASDADIEGKNDVRQCRAETLAKARGQGAAAVAANGRDSFVAVTAAR